MGNCGGCRKSKKRMEKLVADQKAINNEVLSRSEKRKARIAARKERIAQRDARVARRKALKLKGK